MTHPPRRNPARSSKSTAITSSKLELEQCDWFPDIKNPDSIVHQRVNLLNREAYSLEVFARADDLLIYMAFAGKGKKCRHHLVSPEPAQSEGNVIHLSKQEGIQGAKICKEFGLFNGSEPSWDSVVRSIEALQQQISTFQLEHEHWSACLSQYAYLFSFGTFVCLISR